MSKMSLQDENYLWAMERVVQGFATRLGLNFSKQSLHVADEISTLLQMPLAKIASTPTNELPSTAAIFEMLDKAVATTRKNLFEEKAITPFTFYETLKKLIKEDRIELHNCFLRCTKYALDVVRRNQGGEWIVRRRQFGSAQYGVEIKGSFFSESSILKSSTEGSLSAWYKQIKSRITGLPVAEIQLLSAVPS